MCTEDARLTFPQLLDVLAEQSRAEHAVEAEIEAAFRAYDREERGWLTARETKRLLTQFGEKLTMQEGSTSFLSFPILSFPFLSFI